MKLSTSAFFTGLLFLAFVTSCKKEVGGSASVQQLDITKVLYGSDTSENMDVYLPAGRDTSNTKVIMFIHGGSWNSGDKNDFTDAIASIRGSLSDYAMFNINYRFALNGLNVFPAQLNDVHAALDFVAAKAREYGINANKVCLIGASAGAHLALLEGYKNNSNGRIKAVVDLFGPADLTDLYNNHPFPALARPVLVNFLGVTPSANPAAYFQASPINFISSNTVPTKIFHGDSDIVVPITQSYNLRAKLQSYNVKVDMTVYPKEGHGWTGAPLLDTYAKSILFIKENVQ